MGPHADQLARDGLDDFGLIDATPAGDDDTEEERRAPVAADALQKNRHQVTTTKEF